MIQDPAHENPVSETPRIEGSDSLHISQGNSRLVWALTGFAAGMAAMYLFDPKAGRSRRAALSSRVAAGGQRVSDLASNVSQPVREMVERRFSTGQASAQELSKGTSPGTMRH